MTDTVVQKWAVYESNVQQYRILSATVQSFLLAVGAFVLSTPIVPLPLYAAIALLGIGHIFAVWIPIVEARVLIVDYYKGQLDMPADRRAELLAYCSEDEFRESKEKHDEVVRTFFYLKLLEPVRNTRVKLDRWVPWGYATIWIAMSIAKLRQ